MKCRHRNIGKGVAICCHWTNGKTTNPKEWKRGEGLYPSRKEFRLIAVHKCHDCGKSWKFER